MMTYNAVASSSIFALIASSSLLVALLGTAYLVFASLRHHTRTGPKIKATIEQHYLAYAIYGLLRQAFWSLAFIFTLSYIGSLAYFSLLLFFAYPLSLLASLISGASFSLLVTSYLFCHHLLHTPSLILTSAQFRFSRLDPLWKKLSPGRLQAFRVIAYVISAILLLSFNVYLLHYDYFFVLSAEAVVVCVLIGKATVRVRKSDKAPTAQNSSLPNIVMIGTDTLRGDRLGIAGYERDLTPNIDTLAKKGFYFSNCYVPLARTAPSLTSLLTGCWPHTHKIRSNYPASADAQLPVDSLVKILKQAGYSTAAIGDWAAADLGKINFGFDRKLLPQDQWNMKYLIRQGSAFIRLFLSLFTHNRLGKRFLPELYYLAGIPLSHQTGKECRDLISEYASTSSPFFINYFSAAAHVPFGSNYPYYNLFTKPDYSGESRFLMSSFATPEEIIEKQGMGSDAFDIPQINNLYDGCIRQFDDEVGKILQHLSATGLDQNTLVVIYSDHGADFFENGCWGQGNTVIGNDASNRIPLIIFDPRKQGGVTFNNTVRSIDIAPTLLDLVKIPHPSSCDGSSLLPWMQNPGVATERTAFQETGVWLGKMPGMRPDHLTYPDLLEILDIPNKQLATLTLKESHLEKIIEAKDRSIRDQKWKLVYQPTTDGIDYLLFDMTNDPGCSHNVAAKFPTILTEYKQRLDQWIYSDPLMLSRKHESP